MYVDAVFRAAENAGTWEYKKTKENSRGTGIQTASPTDLFLHIFNFLFSWFSIPIAAFSVACCFENQLFSFFSVLCLIIYSVLQRRAVNALVKVCILLSPY